MSNIQIKRAEEFYRVVALFFQDYFDNRPYELVEFCAGNGNAGKVFTQRGNIKNVNFIDVKKVRGLEKTISEIECKHTISLDGIEGFTPTSTESLVAIAIHSCGTLTDDIIERAIELHIALAVMPCCYSINVNDRIKRYSLAQPPDPRLLLYSRIEDYFDLVRTQFLIENDYQAFLRRIDPRTTPMNNVIIGLPN
ncbi:MAG: methyltransferase [archaeon]|nr:SAM-dependent methyltransferase [Nanoarchaeota archaeon]